MKSKVIIYIFSLLIAQIGVLKGDEFDSILNQCSRTLNISAEAFSIERFNGGVSNHVYLLSTKNGEKFAAKIFTKRSLNEVYRIEKIVSALRAIGFQIPETVAITLFQNKLPLHISRFQEGLHATDQDLPRIAKLMAELHIKGSSITPFPLEKYKGEEHYRNLFKRCESWTYTKELREIYEGLDLGYLAEIPIGTIHGDFSYTNLINAENMRLTLIDFDHVCTSYLLTDLVRCHMFYGFDDEGRLQEEKVENFVSNYDTVRPLTTKERQNFYSHMKLMIIDTALEMWYHIYIAKDLPIAVVNCSENKTLLPELLVKKIQNLQDKKELYLRQEDLPIKTPIIFFGMSGAGKTTMIKGILNSHPTLFYIPVFTCTRSPRADDDKTLFEYITVEEFLKLEQEGAFLFTMHEGERYYGYRKSELSKTADKYPILNCSPYGLENAKLVDGIFVLVQGDTEKGLTSRNNSVEQEQRSLVNHRVFKNFYSKDWFLRQMHVIHHNEWSKEGESVKILSSKILEKIDEFENEHIQRKTA